MTLHLICLGKLKEAYWREAEAEYLKRLSPYYKIIIHELKEEGFSEKDSKEKTKDKEAEKIIAVLEKIKSDNIIILDEHGKQSSSVEFSEVLSPLADPVFIIGGPLGLGEKILNEGKYKLSLSKLTFTHQMARVFLLEQIYRATMIKIGKKYHY